MADLAFAAIGGPPVLMNLPVPLQRPYAADPGTLTEWLVSNTTDFGRDVVLEVLAAMNAKYANVTDPALTQERVDALLCRGEALTQEGGAARVGVHSCELGRRASCKLLDARGRDSDCYHRFTIVPFPQRDGTDISVRWGCLWLPWRSRGRADPPDYEAPGLTLATSGCRSSRGCGGV